jgi:hypothetical protein
MAGSVSTDESEKSFITFRDVGELPSRCLAATHRRRRRYRGHRESDLAFLELNPRPNGPDELNVISATIFHIRKYVIVNLPDIG